MGFVVWLALALADDGVLDRAAIVRAESARDVDTLIAARCESEDLARLTLALGRTRDRAVLPRLVLLASLTDPTVRLAAYGALGAVPGGEVALRDALGAEGSADGKAAIWRALGQHGLPEDVPALTAAVARPSPEGAGAAESLGRLARAGVAIEPAVDALLAAATAADRPRADLAAWALSRARPATLTDVDRERLLRAWRRSAREEVRAWLLPVLLDTTDVAGRRALAAEVMNGPWRLPKVALLSASSPVSWTEADLVAWSQLDDPWVRQRIDEMSGIGRAEPAGHELQLTAVRRGEGGADARSAVLALAHDATAAPRERTAAADALVTTQPSSSEISSLLGAADEVVIEVVADHLSTVLGSMEALARAWGSVREPGAQGAVLEALWVRNQAGEVLPEALRPSLEAAAATGPFLVRQRAARLLGTRPASVVAPGPGGVGLGMGASSARVARVLTTEGELRIALDPETAPVGVAAFVWLAEHDAYDASTFHRVVPGFVVQTGDPRGDGMGGPGWFLPDEPDSRPFVAGTVGIARSGHDTGGSQWFVVTTDQPHLAGGYTRLGELVSGLDVARRIDPSDRVLDVVIERVP